MPRLGKIENIIYINQDDPQFDGSSYQEDDSFTLIMHNGIRAAIANEIGRNNATDEWKELGGDGKIPSALLGKHIILAMIDTWEGFLDQDGNEMECTLKNKSDMYDYDPAFFDLVFMAYQAKTRPKKDAEAEALEMGFHEQENISNGNTQSPEEDQDQMSARNVGRV